MAVASRSRASAAGVAGILVAMLAPAAAEDAPPGDPRGEAGQKVEERPELACEICQAKRRFHEAVPWLKLGADLRLRFYYINNPKLDKHHADHEMLWQRHRARFWAAVTPFQDVEVNVRLMGEPRYWCKPDSKDSLTHCEALFDQLNVRWKQALGLPLTITVGRQDMKFGDGWLLRDGVPLDGGRSTFFDAARATWDARDMDTTFDLVFVHNHANSSWFIRPFNDRDLDFAEHNETGAILYASNRSLEHTTIDGYFIYKHDEPEAPTGWRSDIYTFGARIKGDLDQHWKYRAEVAPQWGQKNDTRLCALGADSEIAYHLNDKLKNSLRTQYEYRSGHPDSQDGAFDILWGRWYQGSNLWHFYLATLETVMAAPSNYHRVAVGWGFSPARKWSIQTDYHLLFRDRNPFAGAAGFGRGCFRGQLITVLAAYDHNEHIKSHLMVDLFFPGDYYGNDRNDAAFFTKYQVVFSW